MTKETVNRFRQFTMVAIVWSIINIALLWVLIDIWQLPGWQLKCALKKKLYKVVTRKESAGKGNPPAEPVGLSGEEINLSDKENK